MWNDEEKRGGGYGMMRKKRRRMWNDEEKSERGLEKDSRVKKKKGEKVAGRCSSRRREE
jgi:hypothetical protein